MVDQQLTPLLKARREVIFVENGEQLQSACKILAELSGPLAIDAERASGFKYGQRAYLVQVARRDGPLFLIDPAAVSEKSDPKDFAELAAVLNDSTWILHAATQDLPCLAELGLHPKELFDTELGSRLAGLPRVGLGAVVEHFLGLTLAKEHSAVDWSKRPLEASWLDYAALDIDVLHELADALLDDLEQKDKLKYALQEFTYLLSFKPKPENPDKWRTITGLHEVKNQIGLAVARELWKSREQLAAKLDIAPGRLLPDSSISHVAKSLHRTKPELSSDRSFVGRASRNYLDTWWDALERGKNSRDLPLLKLASTGIPNHRSWPTRWPNAHKRLICTRHNLSEVARTLEIPLENLVSPETIRQICWIERESAGKDDIVRELASFNARNWQIELIADVMVESILTSKNFEPIAVEAEQIDSGKAQSES
jgi:ribonuclease D